MAPPETPLSDKTLEVFAVFLDDPDAKHYGLEIAATAGFAGGTVYPALMQLEQLGWITSGWQGQDEMEEGQTHRRRWYQLTEEGRRNGRVAAKVRLRKPGLLGRLVPGLNPS